MLRGAIACGWMVPGVEGEAVGWTVTLPGLGGWGWGEVPVQTTAAVTPAAMRMTTAMMTGDGAGAEAAPNDPAPVAGVAGRGLSGRRRGGWHRGSWFRGARSGGRLGGGCGGGGRAVAGQCGGRGAAHLAKRGASVDGGPAVRADLVGVGGTRERVVPVEGVPGLRRASRCAAHRAPPAARPAASASARVVSTMPRVPYGFGTSWPARGGPPSVDARATPTAG